ncbi:MAG: hypothetical protein AAF558_10030, partial [Verrucomicrobiota bacterium]
RRDYLTSSANATSAPSGTDFTDINASFNSERFGWIGLKNSSGNRKTVPVQWIYINDSNGDVAGRYAYWIDDESARIDMETAGQAINLSGGASDLAHRRENGRSNSEVAIHGLFSDLASVREFLTFRQSFPAPWPGKETYRHFQGIAWIGSDYEQVRGQVTSGSLEDERGSLGIRKINLNTWAATNSDFTTNSGQTDLVEKVVNLGRFIDEALPQFGDRYHDGSVSALDQELYCIKLAANIQDYIDSDSQPTVIRQNLTSWQLPPIPTGIGEGAPALPPAVFGKEAVPVISEYIGYYYPDAGRLRIDHSFEVWNIHTKDIEVARLGNVRILMAERNEIAPTSSGVDPSVLGEPNTPPLVINVPNSVSFPSGRYSVLSTLPPTSIHYSQWISGSPKRISIPRGEPAYDYGGGLRMDGDQLASSADADTEIIIMNEYGYLDIQVRIPQQGPINLGPGERKVIASQPFGNDGSSGGNNVHRAYPLDSGDPRSFTEIHPTYSDQNSTIPSSIAWRRNSANQRGATRLGGESRGPTYGIIPTNSGSRRQHVPEPVPVPDMNQGLDAISVIRDGSMQTIGELGFIYDPATSGNGTTRNTRQRAGFRTLNIGSRVGELTGIQRLSHVIPSNRADRLLELFTVSDPIPGKILLNSALRERQNIALRSILENFSTQTNSTTNSIFPSPRDPKLGNSGLDINADRVINEMIAHAEDNSRGPFLSLGQLADLNLFNTGDTLHRGNSPNLAPGSNNQSVMDRGREETFRHLVGLLALKGSKYRIYTIGQAGELDRNGNFIVRSTSRLLQIHQLERQYPQTDGLASLAMPSLLTNNQPTSVESSLLWELLE